MVGVGIFGIPIKLSRKHKGLCGLFQPLVLLYMRNGGTELSQHKRNIDGHKWIFSMNFPNIYGRLDWTPLLVAKDRFDTYKRVRKMGGTVALSFNFDVTC